MGKTDFEKYFWKSDDQILLHTDEGTHLKSLLEGTV